jgi:hypothetical protein
MVTVITIMIGPVLGFALIGFILGMSNHSKVEDLEKRLKVLESSDEK